MRLALAKGGESCWDGYVVAQIELEPRGAVKPLLFRRGNYKPLPPGSVLVFTRRLISTCEEQMQMKHAVQVLQNKSLRSIIFILLRRR